MSKTNTNLKTREILFIFDSRDCCPNGEREPGNEGPRIDSISNRTLMTDACFKRIIRDYFMYLDKAGNKIMVRQKLDYNDDDHIEMDEKFLNDLGVSESELKDMDTNELESLITATFIDYRLFGSMFETSKSLIRRTGCVQFEHSLSLNIPSLIQMSISSSMASESGKGAGALGSTTILDYAIFATHAVMNERLAKISGATEEDASSLFKAIWDGVKALNTRTKFQMLPRGLIAIVPKDSRLKISGISSSIKLKEMNCKSFYECDLQLDAFVELVGQFADRIETIEYHLGPNFKFTIDGKEYDDLATALNSQNISVKLQKINM